MDKAKELVQAYIDGWKENDVEKIISPLSSDCIIIESHGPRYQGVEQVKEWVSTWKKLNGTVHKWEISAFYFDKEKNTASLQWDFECTVAKEDHQFFGMSLVKFTNNKISYIHEYRMTQDPYDWQP